MLLLGKLLLSFNSRVETNMLSSLIDFKSNTCFVLKRKKMKKKIKIGNNGIINQIASWNSIIDVKFKEPVIIIIISIAELKTNS